MSRFIVSCGLFLAILGTSCGGSGGGAPSGSGIETAYLGSRASLDGSVRSDGLVTVDGGGPATGDSECTGMFMHSRQLFSFSHAPLIPPGATIVSATLMLYQQSVIGSPYSLGSLLVDHVDYGLVLTADAFGDTVTITSGIGTLSTDSTRGYKDLDVTQAFLEDVAMGRSQFRTRFSAPWNSNGDCDFAVLNDAELSSSVSLGAVPLLRVQFIAP